MNFFSSVCFHLLIEKYLVLDAMSSVCVCVCVCVFVFVFVGSVHDLKMPSKNRTLKHKIHKRFLSLLKFSLQVSLKSY